MRYDLLLLLLPVGCYFHGIWLPRYRNGAIHEHARVCARRVWLVVRKKSHKGPRDGALTC